MPRWVYHPSSNGQGSEASKSTTAFVDPALGDRSSPGVLTSDQASWSSWVWKLLVNIHSWTMKRWMHARRRRKAKVVEEEVQIMRERRASSPTVKHRQGNFPKYGGAMRLKDRIKRADGVELSRNHRWLLEDPTEFCRSWAGLRSLRSSKSWSFNESNRFWLSSSVISSIRRGVETFVRAGPGKAPDLPAPFVLDRCACSVRAFHLFSLVCSRASALFCCSVYSWEQSSKSWGLISMNSFIALYTIPWIVLSDN